jgi:filamentous hemagglutinin
MSTAVSDIGALTFNIIATEVQRPKAEAVDAALVAAEEDIKANNPELWASIMAGSTKGDRDAILAELNKQASSNPAYLADIAALGENPTEGQKQAVFEYHATKGTFGAYFQANQAYIDGQKDFAPGGKYNMASQAITGLLTSAAGGNLSQGIANAAAPLLANQVGTYFDNLPDTDANNAARLLTHAAVGAAVAYLSGNDAASGAAGAVTGEAIAQIIINTKYDGKTSDQLTTAEKEDIRAISTLAATLVGGVTGGSFEDAVTAGAAGYNAVVNNSVSVVGPNGQVIHCAGEFDGRAECPDSNGNIKEGWKVQGPYVNAGPIIAAGGIVGGLVTREMIVACIANTACRTTVTLAGVNLDIQSAVDGVPRAGGTASGGSKALEAVAGDSTKLASFMASQLARINQKLGGKIGQGRLPDFPMGRAGVEQATNVVQQTLATASRTTNVISRSNVRGSYDLVHVYSQTTGYTVSLRVLGNGRYDFDTLIPELSYHFR